MTEPAHCFSRRFCTSCLGADRPGVPAVYVAHDADGVSWYECEDHEPTDNTLETLRIARELIAAWAERHGLSSSRRSAEPAPRRSYVSAGRKPEDPPSRTPIETVRRSLSCVRTSSPGVPSLCRRCGTVLLPDASPLCAGPYTPLEQGAIAVAVSELPLTPDRWTP